ncbi:MAG: cytochrome D1 domain-containing protein [Arcobacteraceae bacterium]
MIKLFLGLCLAGSLLFSSEKIFVVERESSSLAVVTDNVLKSKIENMRNMNHGVVKFYENDGYVISRDGYVIKFDPKSEKIISEYKTSKSAIGFEINKHYVAVANYDDLSVDILDRDLNPIKKIETKSRNVGIKIYKNYLIFSQMDNDIISVYKDLSNNKGKPLFILHKEFKDVGELPFDAMIQNEKYIMGFFNSDHFGVVDLEKMSYKKIDVFLDEKRQRVLKVPHFGFWSLSTKEVFVPAVGDNKVLVYDKDFKFIKNIEIKGLPVFTSLSPKKDFLAVTFSGKDFPSFQIIDTATLEIIKEYTFDGKVLHVRWSNEKNELYVSVNDTNKVVVINTGNWEIKEEIHNIDKPSGIFIYEEN